MREDLLAYYENELGFLRHLGREFAAANPKIASRLALEPNKCDDPHVERLIEAFALLAGRIHCKIDDEFPEITESLLNVLYPHYLRPIPSMSIAQLRVDPEQALLAGGYDIPERSPLYTRLIAGKSTTCTFRTCYPVRLWPLEVTSAAVMPASMAPNLPPTDGASAIVRISLRCMGKARLAALDLDRLRFYLDGDSQIVHILYELLFTSVMRVVVRSGDKRVVTADLPPNALQPVGFTLEEGMLDYTHRSFPGYRVLQEYFAFPWKYLFFDVTGFDRISRAGLGDTMDLLLYLRPFERRDRLQRLEQNVSATTFQLGCTPIVNLFEQLAEPIAITHTAIEYRLIPDVNRQPTTEVYSVDEVRSHSPSQETPRVYSPFYSLRHVYEGEGANAYWYASRRQSTRPGDKGTEVYLTLVDLGFRPTRPADDVLIAKVTCTNRDLAGELPLTGEFGELSLKPGALPRARCLMRPTRTLRPPLRRGLQWRLISHLALNYLSIVDGGRDALQEILKLYDFSEDEDPVIRKQIAGITAVDSHPHIARMVSEHGIVFAQGLRVALELDEEAFIGAGAFLFAAVLERFLGLYTAINSFTQLTVRTRQRNGDLKQWPPRSGEQTLL
jgi:type VI secretion system protein ImpG